jgi:hypothetical protein
MSGPYRKLPGRRWLSLGLISRLYLAADHLLAVTSTRYSETYQRFDYHDIQALVCRRSRRRLAIGLALGIPAALILALGATDGWRGAATTLPLTGPLLLLVLVNALRGPTCVTHLRTAVSVVELPSLARVRSFERAVRRLRPHLEEAQGILDPAELEERLVRLPPAAPVPLAPGPARAESAAPRTHPHRGPAHDVLFALLVAVGLLGMLRAAVGSAATTALASAGVLAAIVALVAALVSQQDSDLPAPVRRVVWVAMGYMAVSFSLLYTAMMVDIALTTKKGAKPDAVFRYFADGKATSPGQLSVFLSAVGIGIGIVGLLRLRAFRAARRGDERQPQPPLHP